jgi:hypothetical protein
VLASTGSAWAPAQAMSRAASRPVLRIANIGSSN